MKRQILNFAAMAAIVIFTGCAERQDANLPSSGNALVYLGRTPVRGVAKDVAFWDGSAYVADSPFGVSIYNLTNPAQPQLVDSLGTFDPNLELISLDSSGRVAALQANSLNLYNLTTGAYLLSSGSSGHYEVALQYAENTLSVYRSDSNPLDGFYVERYTNTGVGDSLAFSSPFFYIHYSANLTYGFALLNENQAYVCLGLSGIILLEFTALNNPTVLAQLNTPGLTRDAALSGNALCLASGYEGLLTVDVSDPLNPQLLSSYLLANATDISRVEIGNNLAILMDDFDGFFALDISNPASPVLVGSLPTSNPNNFCLAGDLILIADDDMGLVVGQIVY